MRKETALHKDRGVTASTKIHFQKQLNGTQTKRLNIQNSLIVWVTDAALHSTEYSEDPGGR